MISARAAKGGVGFVDKPDYCVGCRVSNDPSIRFLEIKMPMFPPVPEGCAAVLDEIQPLVLCEMCVATAARVLGLYEDPLRGPEVQRLQAAWQAALERAEEAHVEHAETLERVRGLEAEVP